MGKRLIMIMKVKKRYVGGIDGLRALGMIGIVGYHLFPGKLPGGFLGVLLFFVLSGYLLTGSLERTWAQRGTIPLKEFYSKRIKRLYPPLLGMLATTLAYLTLFEKDLLAGVRGSVLSGLLYMNNWWQISNGESYFSRWSTPSPYAHLWFIAVEGQFLLLFPIIYWLLRRSLKKRWLLSLVLFISSIFSAVAMAAQFAPYTDPSRVYYGTDTRVFALLLGASLAVAWPMERLFGRPHPRASTVLNSVGTLALGLIGFSFLYIGDNEAWLYRGGMFLFSLVCVSLLWSIVHPDSRWERLLGNPIFRYIGTRSYGLYLYQYPVMVFYEAKVSHIGDHPYLNGLVEVLLIVLLSELSYRFLEIRKDEDKSGSQGYLMKGLISLVAGVALFGLINAPALAVKTETDVKLESQIKANKTLSEKTKKELPETTQSEIPDTAGSGELPPLSAEAQAVADAFGILPSQAVKAAQLPITAFGDSVLLDATADLQSVFPKAIIDADVGRQLYMSPKLIEALAKKSLLKDTVLLSLGTNGSFTEAQANELLAAVGERKVYWVNTRVPTRSWQNDSNNMIAKMAQQHSNVTLVDWYNYSNSHSEWFYDDQIHPNEEGLKAYVRLITESIFGNNQ